MAMKTKLGFCLLLLVSVVVLCASLALASKDAEPKQCKHQCEVQQQFDEKQTKSCVERCEDYYKQKKGSGDRDDVEEEDERREWEGREGEAENTYVFGADFFFSKVKTPHGGMFALPNFSRISKFLRGIEQYKLGLLSILPQRFLTPHHLDADTLFVVFSGTCGCLHNYNSLVKLLNSIYSFEVDNLLFCKLIDLLIMVGCRRRNDLCDT